MACCGGGGIHMLIAVGSFCDFDEFCAIIG